MENIQTKLGFAMCGSFCTLSKAVAEIEQLKKMDYDIYPIMSNTAYTTDTRFGTAQSFIENIKKICERQIISTISEAEPIGPKSLLDVLVIAPCTGNTLAKIANGICDTAVTMAAKAQLRNGKPVIIGLATNDALSLAAKNIGLLLNTKNMYFVHVVEPCN